MEVREFCWVNGMLAKLKQNKVEGKCLDTFELYLTIRKIHTVRGVVKRGGLGQPKNPYQNILRFF